MSGEDTQPPPSSKIESSSGVPASPSGPAQSGLERNELLARARTFLLSPQIKNEDILAKRRFLTEKGLTEPEIDGLLRELPSQVQVPQVPPRTYPQPPPSRLPDLLAGILRISTWVAGGSAVLLLVFYRFILPRLALTYQARHALRRQQKDLVLRLNKSLETLKDTQKESYADIPRSDPFKEPPEYRVCRTIDDILTVCEDRLDDVPRYTLLRCALAEFTAEGKEPTAQTLFERLRGKIPWLDTPEGVTYQEKIWQMLISSSPFVPSDPSHPESCTWSFNPPPPPQPSSLVSGLSTLQSSLPSPPQFPRYQHTHQALVDFTGYLTTQTYASSTFLRGSGYGVGGAEGNTEEEEVKREIRALKGLVLNRRSFMGSLHRPPSVSAVPPAAPFPTP
ncbi:hypothetical protein GLOTRDRAFT_136081 [Gloeophyllum trabeum ATCC 11539]|uniref:Peroxisome membrane anchor protein Pex14p N-terminal domain-containing protein n=1 Tax=Gloeophyllum trabeum (strain ATCC 11539 / FP-39264 / Madison 617) TaxID=670483 RepID=S7RW77_GLOTA|nr:uncharacterized protein GLOTRDRAFT_136081 [Gloeophyllum trabeum ATCC 11539]EPQ59120.1 hypothetical protein GLOTRDRAFT_136081 [Gloeophyllum trabeum ATCC 11539]